MWPIIANNTSCSGTWSAGLEEPRTHNNDFHFLENIWIRKEVTKHTLDWQSNIDQSCYWPDTNTWQYPEIISYWENERDCPSNQETVNILKQTSSLERSEDLANESRALGNSDQSGAEIVPTSLARRLPGGEQRGWDQEWELSNVQCLQTDSTVSQFLKKLGEVSIFPLLIISDNYHDI